MTHSIDSDAPAMLSTPLPPPELIHLVNGHRDAAVFDASRRALVPNIINLLRSAGVDYRQFESILDFGCGCGRGLAGWEPFMRPGMKLYGCDINSQLVDFCVKNIPYADVRLTNYLPPLPYADRQFDFVYACSVYTHLDLPALLQWSGELARIIRPGGCAIISTHGSHFAPTLAALSKEGSVQLARRGYYIHLLTKPEDTWKGSNEYATFLTTDFLFQLFRGFEVLDIQPGASHGPQVFASHQDLTVFRRLED